jgi:hypothetical protein
LGNTLSVVVDNAKVVLRLLIGCHAEGLERLRIVAPLPNVKQLSRVHSALANAFP